jgi:hypothetical protein
VLLELTAYELQFTGVLISRQVLTVAVRVRIALLLYKLHTVVGAWAYWAVDKARNELTDVIVVTTNKLHVEYGERPFEVGFNDACDGPAWLSSRAHEPAKQLHKGLTATVLHTNIHHTRGRDQSLNSRRQTIRRAYSRVP